MPITHISIIVFCSLMITRRPSGPLRRMEVVFSPSCPNASASFEITSEGVASVDE